MEQQYLIDSNAVIDYLCNESSGEYFPTAISAFWA